MDELSRDQITWLNDYHAHVYEMLSPRLTEEEKVWLKAKCAPSQDTSFPGGTAPLSPGNKNGRCPAGHLPFLGQYRIILSADTASEVRQMLSQKRR